MKKSKNVILGIILVIIGAILALNATGITDIEIFFNGWWTLFIIIPSLVGIFNDADKTGNVIGFLIGITLLLACQGVINFEIIWDMAFPIILVIIGLSFIFKDTFNKTVNENIKKLNEGKKGQNEYCATFSGVTADFSGEKFTGADLTAVFGGVKCDLTKAIVEEDVVINASSIFGGIDIRVPNDVKVKIKSSSIFGGASEERKNRNETENSKTIYINATCLFGGVEVK